MRENSIKIKQHQNLQNFQKNHQKFSYKNKINLM